MKDISLTYSNKTKNSVDDTTRKTDIDFLYKEFSRLGKVGGWSFDTRTQLQIWTEEVYQIHEVDSDFEPNVDRGVSFYTETSRPIIEQAVKRAVEEAIPFDVELTILTAKGTEKWVRAIGIPDLENHRVYGFFQDISDRISIEAQLRAKTIQLEATNDMLENALDAKNQFLSHMCHEIRTPLHGVLGSIQLLLKTQLSQEQSDLLSVSRESMDRLMQIINDIMDYSKLDSGKMKLSIGSFELRTLVADVVTLFKSLASTKNLKLMADIDGRVPRWLKGDSYRIKQVLINLLGNAIKFTDKGYVKLNVELNKNDGGDVEILFKIQDTGIGIAVDDLGAAFEKFVQVYQGNERVYEGTGLGLSLVKELTDLMGGKVWVESTPNVGSCFSVLLPLKEDDLNAFL